MMLPRIFQRSLFQSLKNVGQCRETNRLMGKNIYTGVAADCNKSFSFENKSQLETNKKVSFRQRRASLLLNPETRISVFYQESFQNSQGLSFQEWENLRQEGLSLGRFVIDTFPALLMYQCLECNNWPLANSLLEYFKHSGIEINTPAMSVYLKICAQCHEACGESHILETCDFVKKNFVPLDFQLLDSVIKALCRTKNWKETIEISNPSVSHKPMISAAFRNGEFDIGWKILEAAIKSEECLKYEVYSDILQHISTVNDLPLQKKFLLRIFDKFSEFKIFPQGQTTEDLIFAISNAFPTIGTTVSQMGECQACHKSLNRKSLTSMEMDELRKTFYDKILLTSDVYMNTSPKELERFHKTLKEGPFSCIVDVLNVWHGTWGQRRQNVMRMVRDLHMELGGRILLVMRRHLRPHLKNMEKELWRNTSFVYLDNCSEDDPFFLYAALNSGWGTQIVSNDLFRDASFRLKDKRLQEDFLLWCEFHQVKFNKDFGGGSRTIKPSVHVTRAQCVDGHWHIPYFVEKPAFSYTLPTKWLCINTK